MPKDSVSHDDITDVMEMTQKLENYINVVLKENEMALAMSALISASINSILAHCTTLDEIVNYRNIFIQIFDESIRTNKNRK